MAGQGNHNPPSAPFAKGNPGKPFGARTRLTEKFLKAICADFEENGAETIERVRGSDPSTYLKIVASLMPKAIAGPDGESNPVTEVIYKWKLSED